MSELEFAEYLNEALTWVSNEDGMIDECVTFRDVGMMTMNEGLVVRMKDGSEFQLKIVRSK